MCAEGNNDGRIMQAGYNLWRTHFGHVVGSGSGAIVSVDVPKPTSIPLL